MKHISKKQSGFTLIEILLVIAIAALMVVSGVSYLQIQAKNEKVEKSALQIQQWLQAGMAYNVDHDGKWPDKSDLVPTYMPVDSDVNPWGKTYDISHSESNKLFYVTTQGTDSNTANQLKARLPIASISPSDPDTVISAVNIPGQGSQAQDNVLIRKIYVAKSNTKQAPPDDCPQNMLGQVWFAPYSFSSSTDMPNGISSLESVSLKQHGNQIVEDIVSNKYKLILYGTSDYSPSGTMTDTTSGQVLVIQACVKKENTNQASATPGLNWSLF